MNQGIRTLIYPVKDARRSSTFFRQLLGVWNATLLSPVHQFDHPSLHA